MKSDPHLFHKLNRLWAGVSLALVFTAAPGSAFGVTQSQFAFKDADIQVVIEKVAKLTNTTFLFDPYRVKGKITVLAADDITPAQALELLRSVLAVHGYGLVARPEGTWIVAAQPATTKVVVREVRLTYVDAEDAFSPDEQRRDLWPRRCGRADGGRYPPTLVERGRKGESGRQSAARSRHG